MKMIRSWFNIILSLSLSIPLLYGFWWMYISLFGHSFVATATIHPLPLPHRRSYWLTLSSTTIDFFPYSFSLYVCGCVCILKTVVAMSTTTSGPFHWKTEKEKKGGRAPPRLCVAGPITQRALCLGITHTKQAPASSSSSSDLLLLRRFSSKRRKKTNLDKFFFLLVRYESNQMRKKR